jgi:hypothetical protein
MSTKRTIGEVVSVEEEAIEQENEEFEVIEETPELRPTVELEIQGTIDYANERTTDDGRLFGQTLEAYERMQAREYEIERTRTRYDRGKESEREAGNQAMVARASIERRRVFRKRAASVNPWCDPDRNDPREEVSSSYLLVVGGDLVLDIFSQVTEVTRQLREDHHPFAIDTTVLRSRKDRRPHLASTRIGALRRHTRV